MKKKIIIPALIIFCISLFTIFSVGIEIGNVRIGKHKDLVYNQRIDFEQSNFCNQYYLKDKVILLNLWATWCKPCIEEFDSLNFIKNKFGSSEIEYLSLSLDKDSVKLKKFLEKSKLEYKDITLENKHFINSIINKLDSKPLYKHILSYTIPKTYIIKNQEVLEFYVGSIDTKEISSGVKNSLF